MEQSSGSSQRLGERVSDTDTSPLSTTSCTSTVATWTPQWPTRHVLLLSRVNPEAIPTWFANAYESNGYDTEALELNVSSPLNVTPSSTRSVFSSPGFMLINESSRSNHAGMAAMEESVVVTSNGVALYPV
ncbi:hypothetical protein PC129_g12288 [Phytophthora cactorum]|uniref:Uncharacterized protein n=1 Tax=Phytophthora cactorum TaxID=29920 RepID=A0A8T1HXI0_9STRA|nr:hypothetical protein PC111_g18816 [Phytophthora cactorum]KAG2896453.1 hypothetical protein PC114_g15060 [Phytophthora cactorum]KAG2994994.1 hypothetical protein PC118_g3194 [Phytophthora cactorum]KAG3037382.1 hypothetical protein PC119_g3666 [Phytophthora cactorum]KAG3191600.1 hypothetical protein C6341_g1112 [Phytophthora cactorum]